MIQRRQSMTLSPYMALYDILIPEYNELRQINDLIDFSFVLEELEYKYCIDNGRNAIDPSDKKSSDWKKEARGKSEDDVLL